MNLDLKIPPMALMIVAMFVMKLLSEYFPVYRVEYAGHKMLAALILFGGVLVAMSGVMAFKKSQTTMDPFSPGKATQLVISGIYNYSRNPMYLGFLLVLMSVMVHLESLSSVIVLPLYYRIYEQIPDQTRRKGSNTIVF